ncbi:MAG TPA: BON domain-containing protein [Terriglobales bacterium]|nr:BON domain-containing protein [Terriglobales bacterium]
MCASMVSSAVAPQRTASHYDEQILQDVNKYLQSKKEFQGVKATVEDQIITLDGTVNLYIDHENLEKKVKKMKNVDGIRNHVQIQSTVPDEQLRQTLADRLRYDRVGYGIAFNVVTLDVNDGVVTLGGTVHDYPSKDSAVAVAATTPGVKDIIDNIEVAPTSMFDDQLRIKLYRAIYGAPTLQRYEMDPQKPIRIVVENGHVTLYGVVDSAMDKQIAGTQANSVPGVFSVDNQLIALTDTKK